MSTKARAKSDKDDKSPHKSNKAKAKPKPKPKTKQEVLHFRKRKLPTQDENENESESESDDDENKTKRAVGWLKLRRIEDVWLALQNILEPKSKKNNRSHVLRKELEAWHNAVIRLQDALIERQMQETRVVNCLRSHAKFDPSRCQDVSLVRDVDDASDDVRRVNESKFKYSLPRVDWMNAVEKSPSVLQKSKNVQRALTNVNQRLTELRQTNGNLGRFFQVFNADFEVDLAVSEMEHLNALYGFLKADKPAGGDTPPRFTVKQILKDSNRMIQFSSPWKVSSRSSTFDSLTLLPDITQSSDVWNAKVKEVGDNARVSFLNSIGIHKLKGLDDKEVVAAIVKRFQSAEDTEVPTWMSKLALVFLTNMNEAVNFSDENDEASPSASDACGAGNGLDKRSFLAIYRWIPKRLLLFTVGTNRNATDAQIALEQSGDLDPDTMSKTIADLDEYKEYWNVKSDPNVTVDSLVGRDKKSFEQLQQLTSDLQDDVVAIFRKNVRMILESIQSKLKDQKVAEAKHVSPQLATVKRVEQDTANDQKRQIKNEVWKAQLWTIAARMVGLMMKGAGRISFWEVANMRSCLHHAIPSDEAKSVLASEPADMFLKAFLNSVDLLLRHVLNASKLYQYAQTNKLAAAYPQDLYDWAQGYADQIIGSMYRREKHTKEHGRDVAKHHLNHVRVVAAMKQANLKSPDEQAAFLAERLYHGRLPTAKGFSQIFVEIVARNTKTEKRDKFLKDLPKAQAKYEEAQMRRTRIKNQKPSKEDLEDIKKEVRKLHDKVLDLEEKLDLVGTDASIQAILLFGLEYPATWYFESDDLAEDQKTVRFLKRVMTFVLTPKPLQSALESYHENTTNTGQLVEFLADNKDWDTIDSHGAKLLSTQIFKDSQVNTTTLKPTLTEKDRKASQKQIYAMVAAKHRKQERERLDAEKRILDEKVNEYAKGERERQRKFQTNASGDSDLDEDIDLEPDRAPVKNQYADESAEDEYSDVDPDATESENEDDLFREVEDEDEPKQKQKVPNDNDDDNNDAIDLKSKDVREEPVALVEESGKKKALKAKAEKAKKRKAAIRKALRQSMHDDDETETESNSDKQKEKESERESESEGESDRDRKRKRQRERN